MKLPNFLTNFFHPSKKSSYDHSGVSSQLRSVKRSCWIPIVEERDGDVTASKFSGIPYLASGEEWPNCSNCENPMQLFMQLNPETLPEKCSDVWGDGLLQFFYCTNGDPLCEVACESWRPFSRSTVLRIVEISGDASWSLPSPVKDAFPPKVIVGWTENDDYPNWEELQEFSLGLSDEVLDKLAETYPHGGEKLLGWPLWSQSIEYPNCPKCKTSMQLIFQIDSLGHNLPWMFGDAGTGHISQCPVHRKELGFGWACG